MQKIKKWQDFVLIVLMVLSLFMCIKMVLVTKGCSQTVHDTITSPYSWDLYEEGYIPLHFDAIYYIDTTNMVIYYDDYDQFDMEHEYEINPNNINEDYNLMVHISKDNMVELFNRILQWMSYDDYEESMYIQSLFGIGLNDDNEYWITYLGN